MYNFLCFQGEFSFTFGVDYEGETIMELHIPSNEHYLQIGVVESADYADENTDDEGDHRVLDCPVSQQIHHRHGNLTNDGKIRNKTSKNPKKET